MTLYGGICPNWESGPAQEAESQTKSKSKISGTGGKERQA